MEKSSTEEDFNYEACKEQNKSYKKTFRSLLLKILKTAPRDDVVAVLMKLKIIKRDWLADKEEFKLTDSYLKKD